MAITYTWVDADSTFLRYVDDSTTPDTIKFVPIAAGNRDYAEFVSSGATAAAYVAPPEPAPLTAEQKLANSGLTVDELKDLLGL